MQQQFTHLRLHTEFSILDSTVRLAELTQTAKSENMFAVAVTDQSNLFATVKFYKKAISAGIKPIIACDLYLENPENPQQPYSLILLCQNHEGYLNLTQLVSKSFLKNQKHGKAIIKMEWLPSHTAGLIALSGAQNSEISQHLLSGHYDDARKTLKEWQSLFPERFYLEIQRIGQLNEEELIAETVKLASETSVPLVATNAVCFIHPDDYESHEARVCINESSILSDQKRKRRYTPQQYLRSAEEMQALFSDCPEALENTNEIAKRCNLQLSLGEAYLPEFTLPAGKTAEEYLEAESMRGLKERFELSLLQEQTTAIESPEQKKPYIERLNLELKVINSMGFAGYFLIVADFIHWARNNDVPVGPGRGSGAGSIVAYALGITDLDPLQYDLLFERFLNPERVSMPDFDIDFCMAGRDRVIEYVAEKYGRDNVSQIITYGTMAAKAVVRDVGRVLGHPYGFVDKIAKLIPFELGITLKKALQQEEALSDRYNNEDEVKTLIDLAMKLEGLTRNAGKHAGGVVIAPAPLTEYTPLYCEPNGNHVVTQFDKDDVEAVGLVKFDFLGLRTLTIINWTVQTINNLRAQKSEAPIDIRLIATDDPKSYELLKACHTTAVFQLESRGMKDLIKRLQPDSFEEIIALVALFRPGPLQSGMVDDFIDRKHGRARVTYLHPKLEPILRPTYGVILYQEQVMQIAQVLAGYTLGAADLLRRAMGKKKAEEMAQQRSIFVKGAQERHIDEETATYIFDLMEKFAGYGFNKSHSAAYALVAYQTAWLKAHYPAAFMAAVLSSDMDNTDKIRALIHECKAMELTILPPDVNRSQYRFTVIDDNHLLFGLGAIKGVGEAAIDIILNAQKQKPFVDLFDFCARLESRKINRRVIDALICSGAMDTIGPHRAALIASLDKALRAAEQQISNAQSGQSDLFSKSQDSKVSVNDYEEIPEWDDTERLQFEKSALGYYFNGHMIEVYASELEKFTTCRLAEINSYYHKKVTVAGMVTHIKKLTTKKGDRMAIIGLDDGSVQVDLVVFSECLNDSMDILKKDELIIAIAEVGLDDFSGGERLTAELILDLDTARARYARSLRLNLQGNANPEIITRIQTILESHLAGDCSVLIEYQNNKANAELVLGPHWRVSPSDDLLRNLQEELGDEAVYLDY